MTRSNEALRRLAALNTAKSAVVMWDGSAEATIDSSSITADIGNIVEVVT